MVAFLRLMSCLGFERSNSSPGVLYRANVSLALLKPSVPNRQHESVTLQTGIKCSVIGGGHCGSAYCCLCISSSNKLIEFSIGPIVSVRSICRKLYTPPIPGELLRWCQMGRFWSCKAVPTNCTGCLHSHPILQSGHCLVSSHDISNNLPTINVLLGPVEASSSSLKEQLLCGGIS